jgi:hypothetical protein
MTKRKHNKLCKENAEQAKGIEEKNGRETAQAVLDMAFASLTGISGFSPARPTRQTNGRHERPLVPDKNLVETSQEGAGHDSTSDARTDLPNLQGRAVKAEAPPSPDELKARIKARLGAPSRPLWALAKAEAYLHERSAALAKLSSPRKKVPDQGLLTHQLTSTVNTNGVPKTMAPRLRGDAVALYSALQSRDPIDSILDRHIVAMSNSVMNCHARAVEAGNPKAIDINLRHTEKGTKVLIDLLEARERRRGPKQILVGQVNVEAGGQAIVGNVETPKQQRSDKETRPDPSLNPDEKTGD